MERIGPEAFDGNRLRRQGRWVVDFHADWCPYCQAFQEEFGRLSSPAGGGLAIADLTSLETPLWERFSIEIVPTVVVFRDGREMFRAPGRSGYGLDASDLSAVARALDSS